MQNEVETVVSKSVGYGDLEYMCIRPGSTSVLTASHIHISHLIQIKERNYWVKVTAFFTDLHQLRDLLLCQVHLGLLPCMRLHYVLNQTHCTSPELTN